jgi:Icc-related predicted phosphoesterase
MNKKIKIVAISDVHEQWCELKIPKCDILISTGDYSNIGTPDSIMEFHKWLNKQPAKHIISVQGNHEVWVEKNFELAKEIAKSQCNKLHFIEQDLLEIEGIKIYCSSFQPKFGNWAYGLPREELRNIWNKIPDDTDILVTHGPPYQILDYAPKCGHVGDRELYRRILQLKQLKLHIFGHIHFSYGHRNFHNIRFYNVANCSESYEIVNPVTIIKYG